MILIENAFQLEQAEKEITASDTLAVDIETFDHRNLNELGQVRLIQVGTPSECYVFDLFQTGFPVFIKQVCADPKVTKILHYALFDMSHLMHHYQVRFENTFCTYLASRVLSAGLTVRNSLKDVTKRYLDIELDKEEQASDWGGILTESQMGYAAKDVAVLLPLYEKLNGLLSEKALSHVARLEFGIQRIMSELKAHGMPLDRERVKVMQQEIRAAFPPNLDLEELMAPGQKLPSPGMQQQLNRLKKLDQLASTPFVPQLITEWRDCCRFFQKNFRDDLIDLSPAGTHRIRFRGLWLAALSAGARDYRTREHITDPDFLGTREAAMLRALAAKDHMEMERYKHHIHEFAKRYPGIHNWQEKVGTAAVGKKPVRLPTGRIIHTRMFEPHRPDFYRQLLEATIADFIKTLVLLIRQRDGQFMQLDLDNLSLYACCAEVETCRDAVHDAAAFAFGRELPDHVVRIEPIQQST